MNLRSIAALQAAFAIAALAFATPGSARGEADAAQALRQPARVEASEIVSSTGAEPSQAARRVVEWISNSRDNGDLPYMIIDKEAASLLLFDAEGKPLGEAPVLIGVAAGDEATPGVGAKDLSEIGPAERTTPAGRFVAKFGRALGGHKVLWVDYATSVALHAVVTGNKKERRRERLLSLTSEDNRITFGCINVPTNFYDKQIRPLFGEDGGVVYVLPDTKPLVEVFPRLLVQPFIS